MSLNKVMLIGHLGADPDLRYTQSQTPVATMSLATNKVWNDKEGKKHEETEWHKVVVWNKLAELASKHLAKGRQIYIEGELKTRKWDDKEGVTRYTTEIVATNLRFLGATQSAAGVPHPSQAAASASNVAPPPADGASPSMDEIPF